MSGYLLGVYGCTTVITIGNPGQGYVSWDRPWVTTLAELDFIDPPTGEALRDVLFKLNGGKVPTEPEEHQIVRWNIMK